MRVLVAEDSATTRVLLVSHLREWDYTVVEAKDGEQAWQAFQEQPFSLVLTDWIMPNVDGLELIRRIRKSKHSGYSYLILLTAKTDKEDLVTAMDCGADDFLVKPCDPEELRVRLREGKRIIQLEQKLAKQNQRLRETQAALVESEKLASLGQLAAGMAHEINNPIAFVTNNLAVLRRDLGDLLQLVEAYSETRIYLDHAPSELLQRLARIEEDCDFNWLRDHLPKLMESSTDGLKRVRDIISNLRDFARLDRAAADRLNLSSAIESTLQVLQHVVDEKQIRLQSELDPQASVQCRPDKIQQVIYSIVLNAIQASEPGATVEIRLSQAKEAAVIEVQDYGCGMDSQTQSRIFEPFFTTKPVGTGTGLGLAVSFAVVRDHGGKLTVKSQLGQGTTVRVELPDTNNSGT
ncbi:response regulator [Roseimaritima ulvae]|uniref:histidine kinase n=1 Tax=Roseimaritima ulvae TaxID=980254 RepID=A0A5B9QP56_9BACT|nr:response regulator [Roseimaritima ulvae]QEG39440.1 Sensor protein ZraS [Roseimaritima ulvae]